MSQDKPYATTLNVCNVVIKKDGKYLLVQEKQAKVYGKWNLPGGHVDEGETLEATAAREAREETGYQVTILQQLLVHHPNLEKPVLHAYLAQITNGELRYPEDEIMDASWFSYEDIVNMKSELRDSTYIIGAVEAAKNS